MYIFYNRQHAVVYYEQDGDEMYQFRAQADIVTVPDCEILQVSIPRFLNALSNIR